MGVPCRSQPKVPKLDSTLGDNACVHERVKGRSLSGQNTGHVILPPGLRLQ